MKKSLCFFAVLLTGCSSQQDTAGFANTHYALSYLTPSMNIKKEVAVVKNNTTTSKINFIVPKVEMYNQWQETQNQFRKTKKIFKQTQKVTEEQIKPQEKIESALPTQEFTPDTIDKPIEKEESKVEEPQISHDENPIK